MLFKRMIHVAVAAFAVIVFPAVSAATVQTSDLVEGVENLTKTSSAVNDCLKTFDVSFTKVLSCAKGLYGIQGALRDGRTKIEEAEMISVEDMPPFLQAYTAAGTTIAETLTSALGLVAVLQKAGLGPIATLLLHGFDAQREMWDKAVVEKVPETGRPTIEGANKMVGDAFKSAFQVFE